MKKRTIISVGAGVLQAPLIERTRAKGYAVVAIDQNPNAPGFLLAEKNIPISTYNTNEIMVELEKLENEFNFSAVIARVSGKALFTAAAIAKRFKLPGLSEELVTLATQKSALREWCQKNNFTMPAGRDKAGPYPLIIKPNFPIDGKKAISVILNKDQFEDAYNSASAASFDGGVEVEEYVEGIADVACAFVADYGRASVVTYWDELVDHRADGSIYGRGVRVPSMVEKGELEKSIEKIVSDFAKKFPAVRALLILAFRIGKDGNPYIIELHAEGGGDDIADILLPRANPKFDYFSCMADVVCEKGITASCVRPVLQPTELIFKNV